MMQPAACSFSAASWNSYKFTGKERDTESGLDLFGARYYSSSMARFVTPDWRVPHPLWSFAKSGSSQR
jgi:RHS repeat-associated protein